MHGFLHPWYTILTIIVVMGVLQGVCAYLIWVERKISAYMQDRIGPNRLGWGGIFQPIADGAKIFLKEDIIPAHVDKLFFLCAPGIAAGTALMALAVVPLGPTIHVPDSARNAAAVGDELVAELNRQKEATKTVIQGGQVVSQKLGELTTALQKTQQVAVQNAQLKQEVNTTKQRLDALEEELRKHPATTPATAIKTRTDDKSEW